MYIHNPLKSDGYYSLSGPMVYDPIFFPLFSAAFGTATILGTSVTWASVAAAVATTDISQGVQKK